MRNAVRRFLLAGACLPALAGADAGVSLVAGWNLLGNSNTAPVAVASAFGDADKVWTVWKWNKAQGKWAMYAPSLSASELAAHAAEHGYDILTTINPKEGFWVRTKAGGAFDIGMPAVPPAPGAMAGALQADDLVAGWNLVASTDNKNPSQLEMGLRKALRNKGQAIITAWAWDTATGSWRMHAPSLETQGIDTLRAHLVQYGYQPFATAPAPTDGFWLRIGNAAPASDPPASAVDAAKAFMSTLRSNARALDAEDLSLKTELEAVADDLRLRTVPVSEFTTDTLQLVQEAADYWDNTVRDTSAPFTAQRREVNGLWRCGLYADAAAMTVATSRNDARYLACTTTPRPGSKAFINATDANGTYKPCDAVGEVCGTAWTLRLLLQPDPADAHHYFVHTRTVASRMTVAAVAYGYYDNMTSKYIEGADTCPSGESCWVEPTAWNETQTYASTPAPGVAATLSLTRDEEGAIDSWALRGDLAPSVQFDMQPSFGYDGALGQWIYRQNHTAEVLGEKHEVDLSVAWLQHDSTAHKLALQGDIRLIRQGQVASWVGFAPGSTMEATPDAAGSYSDCSSGQRMHLILHAGSPVSTLEGGLRIGACQYDRSGTVYEPTQFAFTGSVGRNGAPFFEGTISADHTGLPSFDATQGAHAANTDVGRVRLAGNVSIPNRPVLSMQLDITGADSGTQGRVWWSGQYAQGTSVVNLSGYGDDAAQVLTLESNTGVRLVLDSAQTVHPLTVNGVLAGYLNTEDGTLEYTDGSYEQH